MIDVWIGNYSRPTPQAPRAADQTALEDTRSRVRDLEHEVDRLKLLNQSLWELLKEKLQIADADLEKRIAEVDMRDGVKDGKMTTTALTCPTCSRVSSSKHWKCLYCGQEFEKPLMG
jgi:hypothetical protein